VGVYLIIYPSAVLIAAGLVRKGPAFAPETVAPIESGRPRAPIHVELRAHSSRANCRPSGSWAGLAL